MSGRNTIVIAVDGLRASALGAYGNTWFATEALDALASRSLLIEWMWCESPTLEGFYWNVWRGGGVGGQESGVRSQESGVRSRRSEVGGRKSEIGEGRRGGTPEEPKALAEVLGAAGVHAALVTDDAWAATEGDDAGFADVQQVDVSALEHAGTIAETGLAKLFAVAIDQIGAWAERSPAAGGIGQSRLLWLHARGFNGAWDAPLALRQQLLDEVDPPAANFVSGPERAPVEDDDALLQFRVAYGAQTMVLDACVGALLGSLAELGLDQDTLVVLVGCRGFALGEHGLVGSGVENLYSELLHVPCLVARPGTAAPPPRSPHLAQPIELYALVRDWFAAEATPAPAAERNWMLSEGALAPARQFVRAFGDDGEQAVRTPAWMLRRRPSEDGSSFQVELFAKPDDRWEANEISSLRPEVSERLQLVLNTPGDSNALAPLDDDLVEPAR